MESRCQEKNKKGLKNLKNYKNLVNKEIKNWMKNLLIKKKRVYGLHYMKYGMSSDWFDFL